MSDEIDHIDELQKRLYARNPENIPKRKFGILRPLKNHVASVWGETEIAKEKTVHRTTVTGYKRFFIFSVLFFILALGAALFSFYRGAMTLSSKNVDLAILGSSFIGGGEELSIQVQLTNKNAADLIDTELILDYPKGATDQSGSDIVHLKKTLGTVHSGKTKSEEFTVVLYGEEGSTREIKATLNYKLEDSSAIFQKEKTFSVMISSSPLTLTIDGPAAVGTNQPFTLTVRNSFSGDKTLDNALVRVEYPNGFVFQSALPAPVVGNNVWKIGDLAKGSEQIISIKGKLVGEEQDEKSFRVYVGAPESETDSRIAVVYNSALHTLIIAEPFLAATIDINSQRDSIVALPIGSTVQGMINWINNSPIAISNAAFTLSLQGSNIDVESVNAVNGYHDPLAGTLLWNSQSSEVLSRIEPGQRGQLPFSFNTKNVQSASSDITLSLSVRGTFPDRDFLENSISNIDEKTIRFASRLQFASQALYSIGPIKNKGPYPPKANQDTTYTVTWTIKPTDNPLSNVTASAVVPTGVVWSGIIIPQAEQVSYNTVSRVVTWNIGSLPKATGSSLSKSVSFQLSARPLASDVGTELKLLGTTTITATDIIAKVPITLDRQPLTTRLDTDPIYTAGKERVVP
jgi:hypothetical protein